MSGPYNKLSSEEEHIIVNKGTERPFTGQYNEFFEEGSYQCKRCNAPLYRSKDKFPSSCGWPSFDDEIKGAVEKKSDADGRRTEILCNNCGAHLGHVFKGEYLTPKNVRHCVNSLSLNFASAEEKQAATSAEADKTQATAYFAGGCFWGVEHLFANKKGVIDAASGYMGGHTKTPSYKHVIKGTTGHKEAVAVVYDPRVVSFRDLAMFFFEIHDPTQSNGQGPDIGEQYLSAIYYNDDQEKQTSRELINILIGKGYDVATDLEPADTFWKAEDYHQDYYAKHNKQPYCHAYKKKF